MGPGTGVINGFAGQEFKRCSLVAADGMQPSLGLLLG
jgi:hypothetical protein